MTKTHSPDCPFCYKEQMQFAAGQSNRKSGLVSSSGRLKAPKVKANNPTAKAFLMLLKSSVQSHPSRRMFSFHQDS